MKEGIEMGKKIVTLTIDILMTETEVELFQALYFERISSITLANDEQTEVSLFVEHAEIEIVED